MIPGINPANKASEPIKKIFLFGLISNKTENMKTMISIKAMTTKQIIHHSGRLLMKA